jgi:hypothetical protein
MAYEPVTIREAAQLEVLLFVGLAFVGGLAVIYWAFQTYRFGRIIQDTPPEPVSSIAMGRTEVFGDPVPADTIYDQPLTEGQCVYVDLTVKEYEESEDDDEDDHWKTVQSDTFSTAFYVDDGTDTVYVDPSDETLYEISDEHRTRISVGRRESPPEKVQTFLAASGGSSTTLDDAGGVLSTVADAVRSFVGGGADNTEDTDDTGARTTRDDGARTTRDDGAQIPSDVGGQTTRDETRMTDGQQLTREGGHQVTEQSVREEEARTQERDVEHVTRAEMGSVSSTNQKRRYIQTVLPLSEETYVFGGAKRLDPERAERVGEDICIQSEPSTGEFIVSDRSEIELAKSYRNRSLLYIVAGLVASAAVLALLVQITLIGPVYGIDLAMP